MPNQKLIKFKEISRELIFGDWGAEGESTQQKIKALTYEQLSMCLLIDIAESLRVLRCSQFKDIPNILRGIRRNVHKPKKKKIEKNPKPKTA